MILEGALIAGAAFGIASFGFVVGMIVAGSARAGAQTFPLTHVSFDKNTSDTDRLSFLDEAAKSVRLGALRQSNQLTDNSTSDQKD